MAKVAMFLPSSDLLEPAVSAASFYHLELSSLAVFDRKTSAGAARAAVSSGADVIIARGGQAFIIAQAVDIPVVEIKLTAYEISLLLEKARLLAKKEHPFIALTGSDNMFAHMDIPAFEERYDIRFGLYLHHTPDEMVPAARTAIEDGADVLIGAGEVFRYCEGLGIPCLRTVSGKESILEACHTAAFLADKLKQEKAHSASLNMLLDHIGSGIIQTDAKGLIIRVNQFVEHLLFMDSKTLEQQPIWNLVPGISEKMLKTVIDTKKTLPSVNIRQGRSRFMVSISPILAEASVMGAMITFHEGKNPTLEEEKRQRELKRQGHVARRTFESMIARSPQMQELCQRAMHYCSFHFPILILGPLGTEKQALAESIHNYGPYKDCPFIRFNCNTHTPEDTDRLLFSQPSDLEDTEPGLFYRGACTIYLYEISSLSPNSQQLLLRYIRRMPASTGARRTEAPNNQIQLIVSDSHDLLEAVENGTFFSELYYAISIAILNLPPLRERREDIMGWVDYHLKGLQEHYGRYMKLTRDAQRFLETYDWPGNLPELVALCNRIMVNCPQYYVDAPQIEAQLEKRRLSEAYKKLPLSPAISPDSKRELIAEVLKRHGGNREMAAAELGISTTTLWRWMKKYRIPKDVGKE